MSSQLDLIKRSSNNGLTEFRFTLSEPSQGVLVLKTAPDGWSDVDIEYFRSKDYYSCNRKGSEVDLIFYKEGKQFIQNVYENSGPEANIFLKVEKLNKTTQLYEDYPTANKPDLGTYEVDEIGVSVKMLDTDFKEKVYNRDSVELDITSLETIEGYTVAPFVIDEITMPDTSVDLSDSAELGGGFQTVSPLVVPILSVTSADFSEMQVPTTTTVNVKTSAFFKESLDNRIVQLSGNIDFTIRDAVNVDFQLVHINSTNVVLGQYGLYEKSYSPSGDYDEDFDINESITLSIGDSLLLQCEFSATSLLSAGNVIVSEVYTGSPETDVFAFPYYEMFLRLFQKITDTENPFKSDFFGRTDTPLTTYASDGEIGFVTKGIYFRGLSRLSTNVTLKSKDAFQSLSSIFRLGLGIETIGGVDKVVIEDMDYFFDNNVVMDISDKLRSENIKKKILPELFYNSAETGFNKFTYENNAGLFEFNTKSAWSSVISFVSKTLQNISKIRGDGQGMRLLLLARWQADYDPTKDVKGDSDYFLIDALRDGVDFKARTNEGFTNITGSVYAYSSYNLRYSPARNLRRWGANIKAGLLHSLNTWLRWQSSDKNTTLGSQYTGELLPVIENADVRANDLNNCKWINEAYMIEAPITVQQLQAFAANPNGIIKLSDNKYGWVSIGGSVKIKNNNLMAEMELLRVNLDNCTPIELI